MKCRHCQTDLALPFLDLGSAPPSNAYLTAEKLRAPEVWYPLRLLVCEKCWLVQAEDHAGRETLFDDDYAYFSSYSTSWLAHAKAYVEEMLARMKLGASSTVVEVAANDGYLLQYVKSAGIPCYGIEPTRSTAAAAQEKGIEIIGRFFSVDLAKELAAQGRQADLTIANNVLAHVPDINDFVAAFAILLKPEGIATFEFPHLLRMVCENQFDTAYHEHYSYLSLATITRIFSANGLSVFDVEELTTHGGSLRIFACRTESKLHKTMPRVPALISAEIAEGITTPPFYLEFQARAEQVKNDLLTFLLDAKKRKLKVAAYGAAAKGNTLLNFAGVKPDLLPYVIDRSPAKQGKYLPGSRIPILNEAILSTNQPDYVLILPWNLQTEIVGQLSYIQKWNGKFVTSVPSLQVLN